jgi:hypothetical protein
MWGVNSLARHGWWLGAELALVVATAGLFVAVGREEAPLSTEELRARLTDRVVAALEQASPTEHHDHGHAVAADDRVACVAEVLGSDPPDAKRVADVDTVYAQYLCASGVPGTAFELSARNSGPVVVRLSDPPAVLVPHGPGYADQVRTMLPDQYEEQAFAGFRDPAVPDGLRPRYAAIVGGLPN